MKYIVLLCDMKKLMSARIELELLDKVSKEGRKQNRSLGNMLEVIIDSYFNPRVVNIKTIPYSDDNFNEVVR